MNWSKVRWNICTIYHLILGHGHLQTYTKLTRLAYMKQELCEKWQEGDMYLMICSARIFCRSTTTCLLGNAVCKRRPIGILWPFLTIFICLKAPKWCQKQKKNEMVSKLWQIGVPTWGSSSRQLLKLWYLSQVKVWYLKPLIVYTWTAIFSLT